MFLVIAEKPSVSQALAKVLSAGKREDGYIAGDMSWYNKVVTPNRK